MSATTHAKARATGQPVSERVFPNRLHQAELQLLRERRKILGQPVPEETINGFPADTVGLACSGGGIRSATFCLGFLQALAGLKLLGRIDYLSTVSGGGYAGSFWGAWLDRIQRKEDGLQEKTFAEAEATLAYAKSSQIWWLRENGRYLTPSGRGDSWLAAVIYYRALLMVQFLLTVPVLLWFAAMNFSRLGVASLGFDISFQVSGGPRVFVSPFFAFCFYGAGYFLWNVIFYWRQKLLDDPVRRRRMNTNLQFVAEFIVFGAALGIIDTVAGTTFWWLLLEPGTGASVATTLAAATAAVYASSDKLRKILASVGAKDVLQRNPRLGLATVSLGIKFLWLVCISFSAHAAIFAALFWAELPVEQIPTHGLPPSWRLLAGLIPCAMFGLVYLVINRNGWLANATSMASFYGSRLTRAYLGASNPQRHHNTPDANATDPLTRDHVPWQTYRPHAAGGPLHFINITLNQTYDGRSNLVQQDRKGLNFAVGPKAVSVGLVHHAEWLETEEDGQPVRTGQIRALDPDPSKFHLFGLYGAAEKPTQPVTLKAEMLSLGQWVGVSGAAFTPGLGARTDRSLSFLLTFFNVRLGWWWDSGMVRPGDRANYVAAIPGARRPQHRLGVLTHLLAEAYARFAGAAKRYWYLSDGGHFENIGAYELLRRRLPFIIVLDCGCDTNREFEDYANLVRKARIDFNAEVTEIIPTPLHAVAPGVSGHLGVLKDVGTINSADGYSAKPGFLARVDFRDSDGNVEATSILLVIKPTLTGDEAADLLNYHRQHREFPQEPTTDQFFDEAQWESYRKLGRTIGERLFAEAGQAPSLRKAFYLD